MPSKQLRDLIKETISSIPWQTKLQDTLPAERVPVVLHEPAILAGYRVPFQPWKYYFYSLFQLHNETANVWTHLIGCCIILHKLYGYFNEFDVYTDHVLSTLLVVGITCLIGLFTSAIVHLLHAKSPYIHFVAFMGDYIGAAFCSFGCGIAALYGCADETTYRAMVDWYLPFLTITSYLTLINLLLAKIWYGHDPHNMKRKYMFVFGMSIQGLVTMAPWVPRYVKCFYDNACDMSSVNQLVVITVIFVAQAVMFAAHQPEKTWPGKFDIVGHGHQIFHVLVVINHVLLLDTIYNDNKIGISGHNELNLWGLIFIMTVMYVIDVFTVFVLKSYVPGCLKKVEKECGLLKSE